MPKRTALVPLTRDDLLVVNCAQCNVELVGERHKEYARQFNMLAVAGRAGGRPYCPGCFLVRPKTVGGRGTPDGGSPYQENAIRHMEDGGAS